MNDVARLRVLVVDEDAAIRHLLWRTFLDRYDLDVTDNGETALALLAVREFDVVVCDLSLSGICGRDLQARAAARDERMRDRFVFSTDGPANHDEGAFLARVPFVLKPYAPSALAKVIDRVASGERDSLRPGREFTGRSEGRKIRGEMPKHNIQIFPPSDLPVQNSKRG